MCHNPVCIEGILYPDSHTDADGVEVINIHRPCGVCPTCAPERVVLVECSVCGQIAGGLNWEKAQEAVLCCACFPKRRMPMQYQVGVVYADKHGYMKCLSVRPYRLRHYSPKGQVHQLPPVESMRPFKEAKEEVIRKWEEKYMKAILEETGGNISLAARRCGLARTSVKVKLAQAREKQMKEQAGTLFVSEEREVA